MSEKDKPKQIREDSGLPRPPKKPQEVVTIITPPKPENTGKKERK